MKPPFVIIGAQRARSTLLLEVLRSHPLVDAPRNEVAHFEDPHWADHDASFIQPVLTPSAPGRVAGFKRPELLARPECPARLAEVAPDAHLIASLRSPLLRTISAYFHYVRSGYLPLLDLDDGLARILADDLPDHPNATEVITFSEYGAAIDRYLRHYGRDALLVLLDDDLDRDLSGTLDRLWAHVGLAAPPGPPPKATPVRNAGIYAPSRLRLLRVGSRLQYRRDRRSGLMCHREGVGWKAANRLVSEVDRVIHRGQPDPAPPPLGDEVLTTLRSRLSPDIDRVEELLGRDLSPWRAQLEPSTAR